MASVVTINRPDVVALIEKAAGELTAGNKTELVAVAVRRLLAENSRSLSLTDAGRRFYERVTTISNELDNAVSEAKSLQEEVKVTDEILNESPMTEEEKQRNLNLEVTQ